MRILLRAAPIDAGSRPSKRFLIQLETPRKVPPRPFPGMDPRFDPAGGSAAHQRDSELRVLARTRKVIVIASLGAAAAVAGLVAQAKPGRSSASTSAPSGSGQPASSAVTGSVTKPLPRLSSADVGSSSGSSLSPPPQAPAAAPAPAPAPVPAPAAPGVSGGS